MDYYYGITVRSTLEGGRGSDYWALLHIDMQIASSSLSSWAELRLPPLFSQSRPDVKRGGLSTAVRKLALVPTPYNFDHELDWRKGSKQSGCIPWAPSLKADRNERNSRASSNPHGATSYSSYGTAAAGKLCGEGGEAGEE